MGGAAQPQGGGGVMDMSPIKPKRIDRADVIARMAANERVADIARNYGVSRQAIYSVAKSPERREKAPDEAKANAPAFDMEKAKDMARKGAKMQAIADYFLVNVKTLQSRAADAGFRWRDLRNPPPAPSTPAPDVTAQEKAAARVQVLAQQAGGDLPQGYIADLIATKGKYLALEAWRKKFGPLIGRDMGAAKALQEWHKYRGGR